jgi:hypothetical protein
MLSLCAVKKVRFTRHRLTSGGDISAEGILVKRRYSTAIDGGQTNFVSSEQ